jgi:hypothetical protein
MHTDHWKHWEHDRWLTATDRPGMMFLYGTPSDNDRLSIDERSHHSYAHHIVAEYETEEVVNGRLVRRWKNKSKNNHYLDASYMADVAASIQGIKLLGSEGGKSKERKSLADLARHA